MKIQFVFGVFLFVTSSGLAASLIDSTTLNGNFETGIASPWRGNLQVAQDPTFASEGSWYGVVQGGPVTQFGFTRGLGYQFIEASPAAGRTFLATFAARTGIDGLDSLSVEFFAQGSGGTAPIALPTLSSTMWQTYQVQFELPETWAGDGRVTFGFLFSREGAISGTTYQGYLDNVRLVQVPEPSVYALFGAAGLLAVSRRLFRRQL